MYKAKTDGNLKFENLEANEKVNSTSQSNLPNAKQQQHPIRFSNFPDIQPYFSWRKRTITSRENKISTEEAQRIQFNGC